jgi:hypothetical protein
MVLLPHSEAVNLDANLGTVAAELAARVRNLQIFARAVATSPPSPSPTGDSSNSSCEVGGASCTLVGAIAGLTAFLGMVKAYYECRKSKTEFEQLGEPLIQMNQASCYVWGWSESNQNGSVGCRGSRGRH